VWSTQNGFEEAAHGVKLRAEQGVRLQEVSADEVRALEPALQMPIYRGLRFQGTRFILHPQKLVERMQHHFVKNGGTVIEANVNSVAPAHDGVAVHIGTGETLASGHFVVAAGAHGKSIAGSGVDKLPLGVERGYHVTFADHRSKLSRPVGWAEAGFYATPMELGLRFAGTVELDDLNAPPNPKKLAYLRRRAGEMLGPLDGPSDEWLGFRPTMPDALPVIGPSRESDRIIHAFGHQHIGLTLGGLTGRLVTDLVKGQAPSPDIAGLSSKRFGFL
jgi:D-amino-acid dehydrogenase